MIWLAFKYGHIKLGPKDVEPEFDDITYFAMLFSAGIGVGLFFYGVSEPLWHQTDNWFANAGYRSQDEIDMFALNLTVSAIVIYLHILWKNVNISKGGKMKIATAHLTFFTPWPHVPSTI